MKLLIGENLKRMRREKDITQEQLAEMLGVSYQSVSRWENNSCYPDMELLPTIASFFETTVDKLLGMNETIEKERTDAYLSRFQAAISHGDVEACIRIAREGVAEYPNNFVLLNKLMYALFIAGDADGNIPEWKENMIKNDAEITALGERIMKYCPDQNIRLEATGRLAFNHCEMGRKEIGRAIYETLPPQDFCKEAQIWRGLNDDEKLPFIRERIYKGYSALCAGLYAVAEAELISDEELIKVYEKRLALDNLIYDGQYPNADWGTANTHYNMAKTYARMKQPEKMFEQLRIAVKSACGFDARPESYPVSCLLLGERTWKRTDFETGDSRPLREIMREKWLASSDFDGVRDSSEFKEIVKPLN